MKNRTSINKTSVNEVSTLCLSVIIILLITGAIVGSIYSANATGEEEWVANYLSDTGTAAFRRMILSDLPLLAVIFVSGYAKIGLLSIAAAVVAKGFISAAPITACVHIFEVKGYVISAGSGIIFTVLSVLAAIFMSLAAVGNIGRKAVGAKQQSGGYTTVLAVSLALTVFGAAISAFLIK